MRADIRLVHEALDLGVRVFDTAGVYGSGASERVLGRAIRGRRDDVVIATKGGYVFRERTPAEQAGRRVVVGAVRRVRSRRPAAGQRGAGGAFGSGSYGQRDDSPHALRAAIEASLRRLHTDRIDVYQLHGPREVHPELFGELVDLVASGKVRAFGIGAESVDSAVRWLTVPDVSMVQVPFGVLDPEASDELFPLLPERPVEVWARAVLGGGLLARAARDPLSLRDDPKAGLLSALGDVAERSGLGLDELAIGFARSFSEVSTVLLGISSNDHLRRNVALFESPPLDAAVRAELVALAETVSGRGDGRA